MVDAKELRIGNYLYDTETGFKGPFKVNAGDICSICDTPTHGYNYIPLTPGILEKAGFIRISYSNPSTSQWSLNSHPEIVIGFVEKEHSDLRNGHFYFTYHKNSDGVKFGCFYKCLHLLQNLIHSLTGEELNIQL